MDESQWYGNDVLSASFSWPGIPIFDWKFLAIAFVPVLNIPVMAMRKFGS
jgi:hypothetical protein